MTEYKRIDQKEIWLVIKTYIMLPGKQEFVGAYWNKEMAKQVAAENLPVETKLFSVSLISVQLHGSMIDVK